MKYSTGHKQRTCYQDGGPVTKKKKKVVKRQGDTMQSTSVGSTTDTLKNRRADQMKAMGLKDGGSVDPKNPPRKIKKKELPPHTPPRRRSPIASP